MKKTSIPELYQVFLNHPTIVKDSRKISPSCIYFALKGENFNGNDFAIEALEKGASFAVVDEQLESDDERLLWVDDVLTALQDLAREHRKQLDIPVIGITGSNGKTTSKELIHAVLSSSLETFATEGNYNNHIGVPLSILKINKAHEIAIIEMGANHQKEIEFLCTISQPSHGLITNIGKAHLEGFGGIEGVKKGKSELYRYLEANNGITFINEDDEVLMDLSKAAHKITYSCHKDSYCKGNIESSNPSLIGKWKCREQSGSISSSLYGEYNFYNALAAVCIGNYFGLSTEKIDQGISKYQSENNRSQQIDYKGAKVFLDAYNANPSSMKVALENFASKSASEKICLLGDMFELGESAKMEHLNIIQQCKALKLDHCTFIGQAFYQHKEHFENYQFFESREKAMPWFKKQTLTGKTLLIKGSRGMALEKLLE